MNPDLLAKLRPASGAHRFDEAGLARYLRDRLGEEAKLEILQFQGGASNPTFLLGFGQGDETRRYVLRKQPPGHILPSAHQVDREFRIMSALAATQVRVPRMRLYCDDRGVIGTPFYVMDFVDGRILTDPWLPRVSPAERAAVWESFGTTMAALHGLDVEALGLSDFGKPGDFLARQIARFTRQYRAAESERITEMEELLRVLPTCLPTDSRTGIVHGDFKLGNVIVHRTEPRVVAVLDWELATIGDPLADLAFSALHWHRAAAGPSSESRDGIPTEEAYVRAYLRRTGRTSIRGWNFYLSFALFRLASIMQGVYRRVLDGNVSSEFPAQNGARELARQSLSALKDASCEIAL